MEIRAVELQNVKSYQSERVIFAPGTNAICGPNGAGKSTLLEAIGYALFDQDPCRPIGSFVREGEQVASITVTLTAGDEREYQIVRKFRQGNGPNQHFVYDPELGQKLATGTHDVLDWLKEQLGLEQALDLTALFRNAIGVPQGLLTAAFLETTADRRQIFNPLLRVEEYNRAFDALRDTCGSLEKQIQAGKQEIAGLQAEVKALPDWEAKAASLAADLASDQARLARLEAQVSALRGEKEALEAARDRVQKLTQDAARLAERLTGLQAQAQQARQALEQAQAARAILEASAAGRQAYLAAMERRQALEAQREARDRLRQACSEGRAAQALALDRVHRLEQEVEQAQAAAAEAERLWPAAAEHERLEEAWRQAQARAEQWEAAARRLEQERRRLGEVEGRLQQAQSGVEERARLAGEQEKHEQRLEELTRNLEGLRAEQAAQALALAHLQEQSDALANLTTAQCPVCESELTEEHRTELLGRNREQAAHLEALQAGLAARLAELNGQRQVLVQGLRALQQRMALLPRPAERDELQAELQRQQAVVQEAAIEVERLAEARRQADALQAQLAAIGNPRRAYELALAAAGRLTDLTATLAAAQDEALALANRLAESEAELAGYGQLDDDLAATNQELAANEPLYQRYLLHEREAAALPECEARLAGLQAALQSTEEESATLAEALIRAREAYRPADYDRVAGAYNQASAEQSALAMRTAMLAAQLAEARAQVARLREVAGRLEAAERELAAALDLQRLLEYLRKVLKEAGPQVTRALVESISLSAARLYADIINDQMGRLRWTEDYEVLVEHKGYERSFQQLSGGEQMAAALAVRLALLHEVSNIDIAFFDEPTSNLDDTRRENLAEQILGVKGFSQLFVVSHDDTFERATDHVVRIVKEDGVSKVVA